MTSEALQFDAILTTVVIVGGVLAVGAHALYQGLRRVWRAVVLLGARRRLRRIGQPRPVPR